MERHLSILSFDKISSIETLNSMAEKLEIKTVDAAIIKFGKIAANIFFINEPFR